jgi:transposase InsO family protein
MQGSMSPAGNCYDNAPMESFWASLKKECIHKMRFETAAQATNALFDYIATFYNAHRLHTSLGNRAPNEFVRDWYAKAKGEVGESLPPRPLLDSKNPLNGQQTANNPNHKNHQL